MGAVNLDQILLTPLKRIPLKGGDVLHALKHSEVGFKTFGEAYFSTINQGAIKAWKLHSKMTLNLVVPLGEVRFVFVSEDRKTRREEIIGEKNYARITVPPGIWFGFQGLSSPFSLVLNVADILHDPMEVVRLDISQIKF